MTYAMFVWILYDVIGLAFMVGFVFGYIVTVSLGRLLVRWDKWRRGE